MPAPATLRAPQLDPWKVAALKIEEDRGEPIGRGANPEVPAELKHYSDRRRFLSIQVAEYREQRFETPHDFAGMVGLIRRGELVEVPPLGDDYILYGVGMNAPDDLFTHYDKTAGKSVALYATDADFEGEEAGLKETLAQEQETTAALEKELAAAPKRDRAQRKTLTDEIAEKRRDALTIKARLALLDSFYRQPARRKLLAAEYEELSGLAQNFGGQSYDLQDPKGRKNFKVRLLSFVRPAAFEMLKELARSYRQQFKRHLPVTSLVRTDEYQHQLNSVNPNATLIETAPHTTGLAFDVYYHFMTRAEQEYVMAELAKLKDAGRVEALRELRDHFHVFAFAGGRPPNERLVREQLDAGKRGTGRQKTDEKADEKADAGGGKGTKKERAAQAKRATQLKRTAKSTTAKTQRPARGRR